ncbi:MAG: response regulator [Desulfobacterales bacterium]|nr:response regulator [Desulfobacterales bacterium]
MEKRVLFVDDEESIREMLKKAFITNGYSVALAESAEEALDIMKNEKFPLMFLDLNLPGMDGIELCRIARKDNPVALIYAVTGYASLFELADCREAGFDDYFKKPVDLASLLKSAALAFEKIDRWKKK